MKYLRAYERYEDPKYNVGDYVLLDLDKVNREWDIVDNNGNFKIPALVLITELNIDNTYNVDFYDGGCLDIRQEYIIRLLTSEEINEYKTKKEANKYNL